MSKVDDARKALKISLCHWAAYNLGPESAAKWTEVVEPSLDAFAAAVREEALAPRETSPERFFDIDGHPCTLDALCSKEPGWAASRILAEREELDRLRAALAKAEGERDKAQANYQFMVDRSADEHLDGYRELAAKACAAEESRDDLQAEVTRLREELGGFQK